MHVNLGQGVFPYTPWNFFDHDPALLAIDPSHAIDQENQIAPESDELEQSRRGRLVVAGRGLMTARANGSGSFPRSHRDKDRLLVFGETGLLVDKSRDGMALIQNSGKAHELTGTDTKIKMNPNSPPLTPAALLPYCRDLHEWPERWMGEEKDLPPGRKLVEYFTPFLLDLAASGLSKKTIQRHVDNLWLLGGEIIRDVNEDPSLRKVTAERLVGNVIHPDGGPLIHNGWEDLQHSFDSTCRKFHRFLTQSQR
jgi:hypothetical protein